MCLFGVRTTLCRLFPHLLAQGNATMTDRILKNGSATSTSLPGPTNGSDGSLPPRHILVVEDNELARRQLQQLLQTDPQLRVETTGDGEDALHKLAERDYSIVITDLRMPRCDGMDLIREVQQRRLPVTVIVTTGHGSIGDAVQAIRMGAYDFLTKPIDIDNLRMVVQRALRERTLQDEIAHLRAQ